MTKAEEMRKLLNSWHDYKLKQGGSFVDALKYMFENDKISSKTISDSEFIHFLEVLIKEHKKPND